MKKLFVMIFVCAFAATSFAETKKITPIDHLIDIAGVEKAVTVGVSKSKYPEHFHKIIVVDHGLGTDVSPRYGVYYAYKMVSEMANPSVVYFLGNAFGYGDIRRESAGVYSIDIETLDYDNFETIKKTLTVKVGSIQQEVAKQVGDFEDGPQKDTLKLTPLTLETTISK